MLPNNQAQYAVKKRRRPQTKKDKDSGKQETKSNPSKRHRDRLNLELDNLAKLIPFSDEVINKLDKLSILRLAVSYLRNKSYHTTVKNERIHKANMRRGNQLEYEQNLSANDSAINSDIDAKLSLQALNGFIVVVTQNNNVFYVSETIQDLLGFPQCDVINSSMLDLIHADDRHIFLKNMRVDKSSSADNSKHTGTLGIPADMFRELSNRGMMHRSFICRLRCLIDNSSGFLALHFTGHIRILPGQKKQSEDDETSAPEIALFLLATLLETPSILEIRTKNFIFRTKHKLDYTPLGIDAKGRVVLGYTEQQLRQRSGYEFIHSADMMHCADAHTKLMRRGESGMTIFRILHKENKWLWVTASAKLVCRHGRPEYIVSTHRPIPDQEGLEHMKKRGHQFQFNFSGQAVLYGEVDPIGTNQNRNGASGKTGSSSGQTSPMSHKSSTSNSSSPRVMDQQQHHMSSEPSPSKRSRMETDQDSNPSLFEMQSMQSKELYTEEAQKSSIFDDIYTSVTTGMMPVDPGNKDLMTLESHDFGTCYYNIGENSYELDLNEPEIDEILPPELDSVASAGGVNRSVHNNAPKLHKKSASNHFVAPAAGSHFSSKQKQLPHHHQQPNKCFAMQASSAMTKPSVKVAGVKRSYPYSRTSSGGSNAKVSPPSSVAAYQQHEQMQVSYNQTPLQSTQGYSSSVQDMNCQPHQKQPQMYPQKSWPMSEAPPPVENQQQNSNYRRQSSGKNVPSDSFVNQKTTAACYTNSRYQNQTVNPVRLDDSAMSANRPTSFGGVQPAPSKIIMTQVEQNSQFPNYSPPDAGWNDLELIDYQQSSTKFDLQEVAVKYQTAEPWKKAQEYINSSKDIYKLDGGTIINHEHLPNVNRQFTTQISQTTTLSPMEYMSQASMESSPGTGMSVSPCRSMNSTNGGGSRSDYSSEWELPATTTAAAAFSMQQTNQSMIPHK